jgi:segregation and condensation protein B
MSDFVADPEETERRIEALLFAAAGPLSAADLARRLPEGADVEAALTALRERYSGRGVELARVAGAWRFQTAEDLAFLMTEERDEPRRLSKAAQETLAIIAYHQPVTRAEIESVRGVQASRGTLDVLLELGLVRMRGRRRTPGRPVTFGTTDGFLEHYGLASLADLPGAAEMKALGLLSLDLPPGFDVPNPSPDLAGDEDPLDADETPEFHQDYLGDEA